MRKEKSNLAMEDGRRPDGVTLGTFKLGKPMIWDVTVRDPYAASNRAYARTPGAVARRGEQDKETRYRPLADDYLLIHFALETTGVWGTPAFNLAKDIGNAITTASGEVRATNFLKQRISLELQRENARVVMANLSGGTHLF